LFSVGRIERPGKIPNKGAGIFVCFLKKTRNQKPDMKQYNPYFQSMIQHFFSNSRATIAAGGGGGGGGGGGRVARAGRSRVILIIQHLSRMLFVY
jgi:hypothetical protein